MTSQAARLANMEEFSLPASSKVRISRVTLEKTVFAAGEPQRCVGLPTESDRVRLIGELSRILHEPEVPESMRTAGLTLIGWLARRMPGEDAHALGVPQARSKRRRS